MPVTFSQDSIRNYETQPQTEVVYMSPDSFLAEAPKFEGDPKTDAKGTSLRQSIASGDHIREIPWMSVDVNDGKAKVKSVDGRHRAELAQENGIESIPVAVRKTGDDVPLASVTGIESKPKAKSWSDVTKTDAYTKADADTQRAIQKQYFDQVIAPQVPKDQIDIARSQFMPKVEPSTVAGRIGTGMMDPIHGGAQLLEHAMPEPVVKAVTEVNNWLASKGLPLAKIPVGGMDEMIKAREAEYAAKREASGSEGIDVARLVGNVASPANIALARAIPAASGAIGRGLAADVAGNVAGGAAMGALSPVTEGDFSSEKALQTGIGAATGGASPFITRSAANIINAPDSEAARLLAQKGVIMTPGQLLGGPVKSLEDASTSFPVVGNVVQAAKNESMKSFNRAAVNDLALRPLGLKLPSGVDAGHDAIAFAKGKLKDAYDQVLSQTHGEFDTRLNTELRSLITNIRRGNMADAEKQDIINTIKRDVIDKFPPSQMLMGQSSPGRISGETLNQIQSDLKDIIRTKQVSDKGDVRAGARTLQEVNEALERMHDRTNPAMRDELSKVREAYAGFLRVQRAAAESGSKEGVFTPAQLKRSSKAFDVSKWKSQSALGEALGQELAEAGKKVLPSSMPESGTTTRRNYLDLAKWAAGAPSGLVASLIYNQPAMWTLSQAARLQGTPTANALADLVRKGSPALTPGLVGGVNALQGP